MTFNFLRNVCTHLGNELYVFWLILRIWNQTRAHLAHRFSSFFSRKSFVWSLKYIKILLLLPPAPLKIFSNCFKVFKTGNIQMEQDFVISLEDLCTQTPNSSERPCVSLHCPAKREHPFNSFPHWFYFNTNRQQFFNSILR